MRHFLMLLEMKMQGLQMERKINRKKRERKRGGKKVGANTVWLVFPVAHGCGNELKKKVDGV